MECLLLQKKLRQAQNILPLDVTTTLKSHWYYSYLLKPLWGANLEGLLGCKLRWQKTASDTKYPSPKCRQNTKTSLVLATPIMGLILKDS